MYLIIRHDDWDVLNVVVNIYGKPKLFKTKDIALKYIDTFKINPFQVVEVEI
jgi:hypothetical protein